MSISEESLPPWGAFAPPPLFRAALRASRLVPQVPVAKQLAFAIRRVARGLVHGPVDVLHWGLRLRLRTRGNISESTFLFMPRRWDPAERAWIARELEPGAVVVDVGANAGGYAWWIQRVLGSAWTGLAVEPDPQLGRRLRFNFDTNGMGHVRHLAIAVGPAGGAGRLRIDPRNRGQNRLTTDGSSGGLEPSGAVEVPVRPLPELLEEAGLGRVDLLKIDVEGLEPAIVTDLLERTPRRQLPRLILTEVLGETPEYRALRALLEERGYRVTLRTRLNMGLQRS